MYVKPGRPYCRAAREHLAAEGETLEERDATRNADWKAELMDTPRRRPRDHLERAAAGGLPARSRLIGALSGRSPAEQL
jgi:hypothetical protein